MIKVTQNVNLFRLDAFTIENHKIKSIILNDILIKNCSFSDERKNKWKQTNQTLL